MFDILKNFFLAKIHNKFVKIYIFYIYYFFIEEFYF
jgi:hypothetical protein